MRMVVSSISGLLDIPLHLARVHPVLKEFSVALMSLCSSPSLGAAAFLVAQANDDWSGPYNYLMCHLARTLISVSKSIDKACIDQ